MKQIAVILTVGLPISKENLIQRNLFNWILVNLGFCLFFWLLDYNICLNFFKHTESPFYMIVIEKPKTLFAQKVKETIFRHRATCHKS